MTMVFLNKSFIKAYPLKDDYHFDLNPTKIIINVNVTDEFK